MAPDFGAQEDRGKGAHQWYRDRMKDMSSKRGDKVGGRL
jgi:hypothetical protein